jgi:hypothetical protein
LVVGVGVVVLEPDAPPVEPLVPPLPPTVPDELLPIPVLLPVPVLPVPVVLPVLEAPRSCRHLSLAAWSESFSQLARADALSVEVPEDDALPEVVPEAPALLDDGVDELDDGVDEEPELDDGLVVLELDEGVDDEPALEESVLEEPELDGRDGDVVLEPVEPELPDPPVVWATAMLVAPRKAAAIAACRIFMFIRCSSSVEWVLPPVGSNRRARHRFSRASST